MIRTKTSITIARPVGEVFEFVTNVENFPRWFGEIVTESRRATPGPMGVGSRFVQSGHFLGRRFETRFTVTEYEPDRLFCVSTEWGPIAFQGCFHFEPADGDGTLLTDRHGIEASGFFNLIGSILAGRLRQQAQTNLSTLKMLLEGVGSTVHGSQ